MILVSDTESKTSTRWVSVEDGLPDLKPNRYQTSMSDKVLVRGVGKYKYPFVAHLHADRKKYRDYAHGKDIDGVRYTWLNPYTDIYVLQKVTHWRYI